MNLTAWEDFVYKCQLSVDSLCKCFKLIYWFVLVLEKKVVFTENSDLCNSCFPKQEFLKLSKQNFYCWTLAFFDQYQTCWIHHKLNWIGQVSFLLSIVTSEIWMTEWSLQTTFVKIKVRHDKHMHRQRLLVKWHVIGFVEWFLVVFSLLRVSLFLVTILW